MSGSLEAVLGPAALRFLRPRRVVGGGGGSYLGLSFCRGAYCKPTGNRQDEHGSIAYLLVFLIPSIATGASADVGLLVTLLQRLVR